MSHSLIIFSSFSHPILPSYKHLNLATIHPTVLPTTPDLPYSPPTWSRIGRGSSGGLEVGFEEWLQVFVVGIRHVLLVHWGLLSLLKHPVVDIAIPAAER